MAKDISKTLILGLGGTGQKVIRDIKKRLLRTYGEIPKLVKFLEFDTDVNETNGSAFKYYHNGQTFENFKYQIEPSEFLHTPFLGVELAKRDVICNTKINIAQVSKIASKLTNKGACGYRCGGRTIFLQNAEKIITKLRTTITELRNIANTGREISDGGYKVVNVGNINVFVIASLAGGTGSSAFMDMSRMLQIAGINFDYDVAAGKDQIFGMFFLPMFFEGKPNTYNIFANTYTALSELDYTWGLNDPETYPVGCKALAEDVQDYPGQGGVDNKKRVVYTSVCLIDALTSKSQTTTFMEASSYVASYIAASIAADNNDIISSFANSNHKMETVDGKYQNYSGIGYCELRFNRQELVRYLLNHKLISSIEDYKNDRNMRASEIADKFIHDNGLNEGVRRNAEGVDTRALLNELTDAIINMTDSRFNDIIMAVVDTGNNADGLIENSKVEYLNRIGARAQEVVAAFADRKEELFDNLRVLLNERQSGRGFGIFPDLARQLKTSFTAMKESLEEEITQYREDFDQIEKDLEIIKNSIKENNPSGVIGRGRRREEQESWLQAYANRVRFDMGNEETPTLSRLKVEAVRKREAIAIYEEMIKIVEEFYKVEKKEDIDGTQEKTQGSYTKVCGLYNSLIDLLRLNISGYQPAKAAVKETLYADAYFKEYFEQHDADTMPLTKHAVNELDRYFNQVFANLMAVDDNMLVEMRQELLKHLPADGLIRKIKEERMSIDEVFIQCYGTYGEIDNPNDLDANPQLRILQQIENMFDPLWQYMPFSEGLPPAKNMIVGVNDTSNNIFSQRNGYDATINGWNTGQRQYVNLGDPDRIVFMLMETAIPAHKLMGAASWANEYNQKKSKVYTFSDKRLEGIEMIMPGANDEAEVAWAYGWLFGLITNPKNKNGIRVKPTDTYVRKVGGHRESNGDFNYFERKVQHKKDIFECHQKFINDVDLSKDIYEKAVRLLDDNPIDSIIRIKQWVNEGKMWSSEVRGKERPSMTEEEQKVIEYEKYYLEKLFARFSGYGVSYDDDGKVTHITSEVLSSREEEMKAKDNKTKAAKA